MNGIYKTSNQNEPGLLHWISSHSWGGKRQGSACLHGNITSKVMGEVFVSCGPDDRFAKTAILEETDTESDSNDTRETTDGSSCQHLWKVTEIQGTFLGMKMGILWARRDISLKSGKKTFISVHLHTDKWVSVSHQPWVHDLTWGLTHRLHLDEEESSALRPTWCLLKTLPQSLTQITVYTASTQGWQISAPQRRGVRSIQSLPGHPGGVPSQENTHWLLPGHKRHPRPQVRRWQCSCKARRSLTG